LNNLRRINNVSSFNLYNSFVKKFALSKNTKEREIFNSIDIKIENSNNIVIKNNNNQEIRYIIWENAKILSYNYYKVTNINNNNKKKNANDF
jgi:hypothetical protein